MDLVFILSFIPIFILLLLPALFLRDVRFVIIWLIINILASWQAASQVSSFTQEQWLILTTSFAVYPFFEALKAVVISSLCLVGVGALIFGLYFIPIYMVFIRDREDTHVEIPMIRIPRRAYQRSYEEVKLSPVPREIIRRVLEEE
ncbi:MAG: hypothetical protein ACUVTD_05265 [Nitrososphaerales archaeon]